MEKNVGKFDRFIRLILAIVVAYLAYNYVAGVLMWLLYVVAVGLLITVLTGYCWPYKLLKINTNK